MKWRRRPRKVRALIMPEVSWSKVGKLVALRNDLAHGSAPMSSALAERHAEEVQQLLDELLTSVRRAGRLACVRSLDFDGSTLAIRGDALQGSGKWSEQIALPTTSPARTGAVVFAGPERLVDLSHWIECRSDGADGTPELLVFDGVQARRGRSLDGTESIRYAEVFSGARDRSIDSATSALLLSER